jgi:hypothetical protein
MGLNELGSGQVRISVFPNPIDQAFTVEVPGALSLDVCDIMGRLVKVISVFSAGAHTIPASDLPSGVYFLTGQYERSMLREKVVISR